MKQPRIPMKLCFELVDAAKDASENVIYWIDIPANRYDLLCLEGLAYNRIPKTLPATIHIARQYPREQIAQAGFTDGLTITLCSRDDIAGKLNRNIEKIPAVHIANPISSRANHAHPRTAPWPRTAKLPFPLSCLKCPTWSCRIPRPKSDQERALRLCRQLQKTAGYEVIHGLLDRVMLLLGCPGKRSRQNPYDRVVHLVSRNALAEVISMDWHQKFGHNSGWTNYRNHGRQVEHFVAALEAREDPDHRHVDIAVGRPGRFNFTYNASRITAMSKPVYNAVTKFSLHKPVIVRSRKLNRLTGQGEHKPFLDRMANKTLKETLSQGVAYIHEGLTESDHHIVEQLFDSGAVQIAVVTRDLYIDPHFKTYLLLQAHLSRLQQLSSRHRQKQVKVFPTVIADGNVTIYPMSKDCVDAIRTDWAYIDSHYKAPIVLAAASGIKQGDLVELTESYLGKVGSTFDGKASALTPCRFTDSEVRDRDDSLPVALVIIAVLSCGWTNQDNVPLMVANTLISAWYRTQGGGAKNAEDNLCFYERKPVCGASTSCAFRSITRTWCSTCRTSGCVWHDGYPQRS
ncbi:hypothetical protein quinque_002267 [Culex quinquefasciatus]